ncbi:MULTISPECIES: DJ-1 family glyoxalase III [Salinivibrio]|jgi:4-methyl-5(b-hydroxyethyl)-thiazole monophosphate biosynthesis|uniref:DJ-1 family protein n=1 Tax=Salinivibrio costicola TaxID=51367 RepID=A0ABX6K1W9_SALCS|nr:MULTISPECIES: DJ-1 family glyoxalase III [Salinivibrio]PCE69111.1 DJ-1 family protein [Salinivibrio sp. YCSC6]QCF36460.1 DJ-1 family protein [Salinivibrio sp. YCSC6]QIR05562.1 DJ-1 family protein [Salinivibrio costicola]
MKPINVLVCVAPGSEEMETVTAIDVMKRAGFCVTVASADPEGSLTLTCSRGVQLVCDAPLASVADQPFDCVILPGGIDGAQCLGDSAIVTEIIKQQQSDHAWVAAICAAPALVLQRHQLYPTSHISCHPSVSEQIPEQWRSRRRVMTDYDHKLITSQGPGSALEFAIEIVHVLAGKALAWQVAEPMVPLPNLQYEKKFAE